MRPLSPADDPGGFRTVEGRFAKRPLLEEKGNSDSVYFKKVSRVYLNAFNPGSQLCFDFSQMLPGDGIHRDGGAIVDDLVMAGQ